MMKKKQNKKSFLLYQDQREVVESLSDKQAGKLFKAIFQHADGEQPKLDSTLKIVFIPIRQALDRFKENYDKVCEINRKNVNKRWKQARKDIKVYDCIRPHTNEHDSDSDSDIKKEDRLLREKAQGKQKTPLEYDSRIFESLSAKRVRKLKAEKETTNAD